MARAVIVGAGIGGLSAAAALARAGLDVTVLEAHVSPGGCAATYFHQGYRFDAGATLAAGFYPGGPMEQAAQAAGVARWPVRPAEQAMQVHLPDGAKVVRRSDASRWEALRDAFGAPGIEFFRWQERTADALWDLALRRPPWPLQSLADVQESAAALLPWASGRLRQGLSPWLALDAFLPVAAHLRNAPERLRLFVDGQLLIAAQAESARANALYGAAALDLPRRGVVHVAGGMGAIAETLAEALRRSGGRILYRQEVTRIRRSHGRPVAVETKRGDSFPADLVLANLTPWNAAALLKDDLPPALKNLPLHPQDGWGAFALYAGVDGAAIPQETALHHQVLLRRPLGEGSSVFVSISPAWDGSRAPAGQRALTISTHTKPAAWYELYESDRSAYEARQEEYVQKLLAAAEVALPGLRDAVRLILPGTPLTFERFTRRAGGWVGGFPQTNLRRSFGARLAENLWLVGDSIFPGQSTAAVALGGLRVAETVLRRMGTRLLERPARESLAGDKP